MKHTSGAGTVGILIKAPRDVSTCRRCGIEMIAGDDAYVIRDSVGVFCSSICVDHHHAQLQADLAEFHARHSREP